MIHTSEQMPRKKELSPFAVIKKTISQEQDVLTVFNEMSEPEQRKVLTMVASHLCDKGSWAAAHDLLEQCQVTPATVNDLEQGIVLINVLLNGDTPSLPTALEVFEKLDKTGKIRKKHLALISAHCRQAEDWSLARQLFENYHKRFPLDVQDLDWVFHRDVPADCRTVVLDHFSGTHSHVQTADARGIMEAVGLPLVKIPFNDVQCQEVLRKLPIPKSIPQLKQQDGDKLIIVDAANVMYFNHHDQKLGIQPQSYYQLNNLVTLLQDTYPGTFIVLVLHERHFKLAKYEKWHKKDRERVDMIINEWYCNTHTCVYKTPYCQNDDHYSIYLAVKFNCPLVTNDQFLDHINKIPLLKVWRSEMIIGYDIALGSTEPTIAPPLTFSHRHQCDADNYYIPTEDPQAWKVVSRT